VWRLYFPAQQTGFQKVGMVKAEPLGSFVCKSRKMPVHESFFGSVVWRKLFHIIESTAAMPRWEKIMREMILFY